MNTDSLKFTKTPTGEFVIEWDKEDPEWKWLNSLTSAEIQILVKKAIEDATS